MQRLLFAATILVVGLCGCNALPTADATQHGRFVGIGIYHPEAPWTRMVGADAPKVTGAARTPDDQAIIVVEDSKTGEIRACGDLTGYCIGMNPWKGGLGSSQTVPIELSEHAAAPKSGDGK